MPEISTQTEVQDFPDKANTYLELLLTWKLYNQSSCICRKCGKRFKVGFFENHNKECKFINNLGGKNVFK